MTDVRMLKPGILVSIRTHQSGNRSYRKQELERAHITEGGVERSAWNTTKFVYDPAEAKEANVVANRARYIVTRLCADTAHGPLCPTDRREELDDAIREAREMVRAFNETAVFSRVEVNVICGEIVADDVNTARAMFSETGQLMTQMQEAVEALDPKRIQALCTKALSVGQILSPDANASVVKAVNIAREARRRIVAAGEQAAIQLDERAIEAIGRARSSFLDFGPAEDGIAVESARHSRALDFEPGAYDLAQAQ